MGFMWVLGVESTCDETACAIVCDGKEIKANVISTQIETHAGFGGVVPELASRRHIDLCVPVLKKCLYESGVSLEEIDLIACSRGPGLIGALLVGWNFAKGLALGLNKPFVGVNHIEAHLYAALMETNASLPALGVVLSGGHTALVIVHEVGRYELIGQTQDDAIGEAFDKVATMLDLPYPGGPQIEKLAKEGDPYRFSLKAGQIKKRPHDFSFSGLKTGVLYLVKGQNQTRSDPLQISEADKKDVAASFQHVAFTDIVEKALKAAAEHQCRSILVGGGVSHNQYLRSLFAQSSPLPIFWPPAGLCLDNAAMIAGLGYCIYTKNPLDASFDLEPLPRIPL